MTRKSVQQERRRQIMEALHKCLLKKPFDQTSIKDIAATARINHGMLHYYFKSKDDILLNYIEYVIERYKTLFEDWIDSKRDSFGSSKDILRASFNFMYQKITLNRDLSKIFIEIWEIAIYNRKVKEKLQKAYSEWIETVTLIIREVSKDENTSARLSMGLVAFLEGVSLLSVILDKDEMETQLLLKDFEERVLKMIDNR
ncbi:MAG: TetR/AcrR family transcriptional regulator [Deltaproteobacteria bacterium]|nr:MAG: TetR/AcrR family transcriptional regulator [Deltaproteobacteria bacterium]